MKAYRRISDVPESRIAKGLAGYALMALLPRESRQVRHQPFSRDWGLTGRLIRNGHLLDAVRTRNHELIHSFLVDYWSSPRADEFFDHFGGRFEGIFLKHHAGIVAAMRDVIATRDMTSPRLVELGSGDGRVLEYLADHLPGLRKLNGIDLNRERTEENRRLYRRNARLDFHNGDGIEWLARHPSPDTILFTNGGVCEYLTRRHLLDLFSGSPHGNAPRIVALTETIATDHDLENEANSFPYGHEMAFSHNYPRILLELGFRIDYLNDRPTRAGEEHHPSRWLQVVASRPAEYP